MPDTRKIATVTVLEAVDGTRVPAPPRRRTSSKRSRVVIELDPDGAKWRKRAYAQALAIARGDSTRLEVCRDGSVIVHNNPVR